MFNTNEDFVPIREVEDVADRIIEQHACFNSTERMIVDIAGRPGSGKSYLANVIANAIHDRSQNGIRVVVMPMDGYHLYREELSRLPNSEYAFARRGAHWTFNSEKLYNDLTSRDEAMLRAKGSDFKNGNLIDTTKDNVDVVCHSQAVLAKQQ